MRRRTWNPRAALLPATALACAAALVVGSLASGAGAERGAESEPRVSKSRQTPAPEPGTPADPVQAYESQTYLTAEFGLEHPTGVAHLEKRGQLAVAQRNADGSKVLVISPERDGKLRTFEVDGLTQPRTLADNGQRLAALGDQTLLLWTPKLNGNVKIDRLPIVGDPIDGARGMTYDPLTRRWLVLDATGLQIIALKVLGKTAIAVPGPSLAGLGSPDLLGLALDPFARRLYVGDPAQDRVMAISADQEAYAAVDLVDVDLARMTALEVGPTADPSDNEAVMSLYAADAGDDNRFGRVAEVSLSPMLPPIGADGAEAPRAGKAAQTSPRTGAAAAMSATTSTRTAAVAAMSTTTSTARTAAVAASTPTYSTGTLVRATNLWQMNPPAPDSAGIVYMTDKDRLFISDSEVDEMPLYQGVNLWQIARDNATPLETGTTVRFSSEPSGIGYDPERKRMFIADDNKRRIFEVTTGPDNRFGTADDAVSYFSTSAFGNDDPEDVTYDTRTGDLFLTEGVARDVWRVEAGPNGRFDGVGSAGDDVVSNFDAAVYGSIDLEGIGYSPTRDSLFLADRKYESILEVSKDGALIQSIDVEAIDMHKPAGITLAPATDDPTRTDLYVVTRGVDNNGHPEENDGMLYEISAPDLAPVSTQDNVAPVVDAGPDSDVTFPSSAILDGTVSDDGLPNPPGFTTTTWSKVTGPGDVTFTDASAVDTTATFSEPGVYILRLAASDSDLTSADDVTVLVSPPAPTNTAPSVSAGPDQTVRLPASASLSGLVSDDGMPDPPGATTVQWSKVSGPGSVTFTDATSANTLASFGIEGVYTLRLTADDSELTASDDLTVIVEAPPPSGNLIKNPGFEINDDGWKPAGGSGLDRVGVPRTGSWSGQLTRTSSSSGTCRLNDSPNWIDNTVPATYTLTAWVKGDAAAVGEDVRFRVREYEGSSRVGIEDVAVTLSTSWQQLVLTYVPAAPGQSTLDLDVIRSGTPSNAICFWVDDLSASTS